MQIAAAALDGTGGGCVGALLTVSEVRADRLAADYIRFRQMALISNA